MLVHAPALLPETAPRPLLPLPPVSPAELNKTLLTGLLVASPARRLANCGGAIMPHPLGMGHFVSQLLQLRRRIGCIWLLNVHPVLRRCLHQSGVGALFHLSG